MTYVMSDIHGDYEKYRRMLEVIDLGENDELFVLGDIIDRGENGVKILFDMMSRPNVFPLAGNHEFTAGMCLPWLFEEITNTSLENLTEVKFAALNDWILNGGAPTLRSLEKLTRDDREAVREYIVDMELYAEIEVEGRRFVLTHSGIDNFQIDKPLDNYTPVDLLFFRPETPFYRDKTEFYRDKTVIFGHTPTKLLCGEDRIVYGGSWIDIDCGCGWGGGLGCLRLEDMREFYI